MRKLLLWMLCGGMTYYAIEGVWHIPHNGGWANISMLAVGGLCFALVGAANQIPAFYNLPMRAQALIGACIALALEFASGCVLNLWLRLGLWDYSQMSFNIMGQICLTYGILWLLLMPLAIWLEDRLTLMWVIYNQHMGIHIRDRVWDYTLKDVYWEFLFGRQ